MGGDPLLKVIEGRRAEIRDRWTREVVASSPKYADLPLDEVMKSVDTMISGLAVAASRGDYSVLFEFIGRIVTVRSSMGFKLTELQRVVNIGTGIVLDELMSHCKIDEHDECFNAMKRLLDVMFWASMNLGDTFEEIRGKEFTAGTLVALGAAQEDIDEKEILRKSLDTVMGLMRCDYGSISMMHLGGCAITVPKTHRQCQELFSRLGATVARTMTTVVLKEEEVASMVRPDPHRKEDPIRCAAGVPIRAKGKVMGALMLGSSYERTLSPHEGGFLEAVASQIGLACDNARLMQQIKGSEEFLRKEHGEVLTVLNELGAMVYVADMDTYELLAANKPLQDALGTDIVGKVCYEALQTDQDGPCAFCTNRHLVRDGIPTGPYVWKFRNTITGKWYRCLDRAIQWPDGRLVRLEIALDITDIELANARLEEIGSMLGLYNDLLVHDIGNYAGAAKAFVQLLTDPATEEGKKQEMARTALNQLRKIDTLVDRISKLTKTKVQRETMMDEADLGILLDESVSDISGTLDGSKVKFVKEYDRRGYRVRLGEFASDIFLNLLSNAVKYGGGRPVTVRVSDSMLGGAPAWKVSVVDEGPGVPPEKKKLLFGRYTRLTTMSQLKGQGLGLTIVKTLAEAYGGDAGLEDRVQGDHTKGSIFYVTFPKTGPRKP